MEVKIINPHPYKVKLFTENKPIPVVGSVAHGFLLDKNGKRGWYEDWEVEIIDSPKEEKE